MADLRDGFDVNITDGTAPVIADQAAAAGMGSLRRGFQSGLLASDANALAADEASLRARGDIAGADALRRQIGGIQQRQAVFAPPVQRVEDIDGLATGADWLGGQVGQGAASMLEPVAAATALGALGRVGRLAPGGLGRALGAVGTFGAPAAAFGVNQRQLKGEFVNDAVTDPELMRRTSPEELNRTAELYGAGAGALDTVLPSMVGRQLTGAGLRRGIHALGPAPRVGLELLGEGATEAAQTVGSQQVQGALNPNRDTTQDASEVLNAFAGGAAGAGPFAAAGVMADNGYRRVGDTAQRLGTKAGETIDMARDAVAPAVDSAVEKGRGWIGRGKSAIGQVMDLAKNDDGEIDVQKAVDAIKAPVQDAARRFQVSREEQGILNQDIPDTITDPDARMAWVGENDQRRGQLVADRLGDMAENDPAAAALLDRLEAAQDPAEQQAVIDEGAAHVLKNNEMERLVSRAERAAGAAGEIAGKAGKAVGQAAMKFGKAVFDGAKAGVKKNEQANESLEEFEARMNAAADVAEASAREAVKDTRFSRSPVPQMVKQAVLRMSVVAPQFKEKSLTPGATLALSNTADTLRVGLGEQAPSVLQQLEAMAPKEAHPLFQYLRREVEQGNTPAGRKARAEMRQMAANELMTLLPQARRNVILRMEGTTRSDGSPSTMSRDWLLETVEAAADGEVSRQDRADLEALFGDNWPKALETVNFAPQEVVAPKAETVDDRGTAETLGRDDDNEATEGTDDFERGQAEKKVAKGSGPKIYGFAKTTALRGSQERRDPFSPLAKMSAAERTAFEDENLQRKAEGLEPLADTPVKRPNLFKKDDKLFVGGANALEKKIADVTKALGDDANYNVEARSARDVIKDLGYGKPKILSLYRDYLRQDGDAPGANLANKAVLDAMDEEKGGVKSYRLTPGERRNVMKAARDYFDERFLVVAEQLSDRDPSKISAPELLELGRLGDKAHDFAKDDSGALAEQNLLTFQSDLMPRKGGNKDLRINAASLVGWVRKQRAQGETGESQSGLSNRAKNEAYLTDLMEGISIVLGSGLVDNKLPTITNPQGRVESFEKGVPPSLRLVTTTFAGKTFADQKRREARGPVPDPAGPDPERVAAEQDRDFFVPDEGVDAEPTISRAQGAAMSEKEAKQFAGLKTARGRRNFLDNLALRASGEQFSDATDQASDGENVTPLDNFDRTDPRATLTGAPDEFADQRFLSNATGATASAGLPGIETRMDAQRRAAARGDALASKLGSDFQAGLAELQTRLRTAARPPVAGGALERKNEDGSRTINDQQAVGGSHYIWPAAHALNADRVAALDLAPAEAQQIVQARREAARIILEARDLTEAQKIALTRSMAPAASADRITVASYQRVLEKAAAPEVAAQAPKTQTPPAGAAGRAGFTLSPRGPYTAKDQAKASRATAFIGRGSARSSTAAYRADARAAGVPANAGAYTASDVVFVSAEGDRSGRVAPDLSEISKAMRAGATILTDDAANRARAYNIGERQVEAHLKAGGYIERSPGEWVPGARRFSLMGRGAANDNVISFEAAKGDKAIARAREVMENLSPEDYETLQNDVLARDPNRRKMPTALKGSFREWLSDYNAVEREEMMSSERQDATEAQFYEEVADSSDVPLERALATAMLTGARLGSVQNAQDARDGNSAVASEADMQEAAQYVRKVLGPRIQTQFEELTGHSGEWVEAENAIKISTTAAAGVLQTAYHEALHAFFSRYVKGEPRALEVMKSLAENDAILSRVRALLHRYPKAQAQLADGEERLAYIYQFWAAGLLDLPTGKGRTWLQKVAKFFRRVLGTVADSERAVELFEAFHAGQLSEPSAAGKVIQTIMDQGTMSLRARRKLDGLMQGAAAAVLPANEILLKSASERARMLAREFYANPGEEAAGAHGEGYLNARTREAKRYKNLFAEAIDGLSARDLNGKDGVSQHLQAGTDPADIPYKPVADAVRKIRQSLDRFYDYMKERGVDVGYIERYYPVVWDTNKLVENEPAFIKMLVDNYADVLDQGIASSREKGLSREDVARRILAALMQKRGGDNKIDPNREDGVLVPFFESGEGRVLNWIAPEHREPFLEKDLIGQMSRYFHQGARAAEYTSRFGRDGAELDSALTQVGTELQAESHAMLKRGEFGKDGEAAREKWVERQVRDVRHAVGAMEGTLGKDISPTMRKLSSYMTVYQNVRLLPLSLFSSFVDPLAIIARGGEVREAYDAFLGGMREVFRTWRNAFRDEPLPRQRSEWEELAEFVGAIDSEIFSHYISEEYASEYMTPLAKRINDKMFVLNGMEAWNRSMRVAATKAAVTFLQKHKGLPTEHSARWLAELGLTPKDIHLDADGRLITDRHVLAQARGIPLSQATEDMRVIHFAINRWVEGAVLTPNAAQRPSWSSDPRYSIFFHLKQFTYSFHQTVLKRAVKELEYGNLTPMGVFAWYVPTMIAADVTKGLLVGGGELPNYMKAYNAGDWVMHGAQRAGLLGVGQIGVDANADLASIGGPAIEQAIDALRDPLQDSTIRALPLHGLYREALR